MLAVNRQSRPQLKRIWTGVAIVLSLFAAAAAWKWTPLAEFIAVERWIGWAVAVRQSSAPLLYVLAAYVAGSLLLIPITALILVTAMVFGPELGSVYAMVGCAVGALVTYAVGYILGREFVRKLAGEKWERIERKIDRSGIIAVATLRLLPVAPFSVVNIVSGAFKVPLRDYFIGSLLGLAPGVVITNLFAHQLERAIRNPGPGTFLVLLGLVIVTAVGVVWIKRRMSSTNRDAP